MYPLFTIDHKPLLFCFSSCTVSHARERLFNDPPNPPVHFVVIGPITNVVVLYGVLPYAVDDIKVLQFAADAEETSPNISRPIALKYFKRVNVKFP